ncbi:hypothetical protein AMECASPLE_011578 [Ameca splendens]|uniref:Uncharacterized protein n=1 Tax=Ameca splendens TaxID=208324 RepID=A0ABV0ZML0_9TELE
MPAFPNPVYSLTDRLKAEKDKVAFTLDEAGTVLAAGCMKDAGKTMVLANSFVIEKRVISNLLYFLQLFCGWLSTAQPRPAIEQHTHTLCFEVGRSVHRYLFESILESCPESLALSRSTAARMNLTCLDM